MLLLLETGRMIGFAALVAITVYVIMDIEYPRLGLIRVDDADRALLQLTGEHAACSQVRPNLDCGPGNAIFRKHSARE